MPARTPARNPGRACRTQPTGVEDLAVPDVSARAFPELGASLAALADTGVDRLGGIRTG